MEILQYGVPLVCAVIAYMGVRQGRENKRLRRRLRIALDDCLAFYAIEEAYCASISDGQVGAFSFKQPMAIKRVYRAILRARGLSLSDYSSPQRLKSDLAKL